MKFFAVILSAVMLFSSSLFASGSAYNESDLQTSLKDAEKYNKKHMSYKAPKPFKIYDAGTEEWIDYSKYGEFKNAGTAKYRYEVSDPEGLRAASGEGIFPNTQSVLESKGYKKYDKENKLAGDKWNFVNSQDYQANFYKWATVKEDPGVKLYFTAVALDKAGNYKHALKAYYACLVFFPRAVGYNQWGNPWYIGPVCINRINYLTREHPELGVKLEGAEIKSENLYDNDTKNDVFYVNPGRLVLASPEDFKIKYSDPASSGVKQAAGNGKTKLVQYGNWHFGLTVDDKPFIVRGMTYGPNKVGLSPVNGTVNNIKDWSFDDYNNNGRIDGPYDAWVDANRNEKQDVNEKSVGDFALMKEMGVNTLRLYQASYINKELLKDGYENYGFMYLIGDLIGMYCIGSGAAWEKGTDYTDPAHRKNMLESVRKTVEDFKDEPYVLMWVLGNENNYGKVGATNADKKPEAYYKFVNECALLIKSLDSQKRPVAICNGDLFMLDYCAKYAPDIDIYGTNAYRSEQGFGPIWQDVKEKYGKAVLITEYGCPAFAKGWSMAKIETGQASYHKGNWTDIESNSAGMEGGAGNSLGGIIFEWSDEWWKAEGDSDPFVHDETAQSSGAFLDGGGYEEWYGLCGLGDGKDSEFKRQLRAAYFMYRGLWKKQR